MKRFACIVTLSAGALLFSCARKSDPLLPYSLDDTGAVLVSVELGGVGKLAKALKTTDIAMKDLIIVLSADNQPQVNDTITLDGENNQYTERRTYAGLAAWVNGNSVEWTLSVKARDQNDTIIHTGDTAFIVPVGDTIEIPLALDARYSMLHANFFPIRDNLTRCELIVDDDLIGDYAFSGSDLAGDTVTLTYDYLKASPEGDTHHIVMNVYGTSMDKEILMNTGDTTIAVRSGEDVYHRVKLYYVGPDSGTLAMMVVLGRIGTVNVNGALAPKYWLKVVSGGNRPGSVSPSDSLTHGIPYTITATPRSPYYFYKWKVTSGSAIISDRYAAQTSVKLENGDATVSAVFTDFTFCRRIDLGNSNTSISVPYSILQTIDGGYCISIMVPGLKDEWFLITLDAAGYEMENVEGGIPCTPSANLTTIWDVTFDGTKGTPAQQTSDGGYIVTGSTRPFGSGGSDIYLTKTDPTGDTLWTKTFGGDAEDYGNAVQQTTDGGYIITGSSNNNVLLMKTDSTGTTQWSKTFEKNDYVGYSVRSTTDGRYLVLCNNPYVKGSSIYLIKTDLKGDTVWTHTFGDQYGNKIFSVQPALDGGYIVIASDDDDYTYPSLLIKTDKVGSFH